MASFNYRLNPLYAIKECMSCGALYTADFCCSKGGLKDKILVPKPPQNCATCGDPVDGLNCRSCAFVRKCLNEGWYTIHEENKILNTSDDNTNIELVDSLIMEDEHLDTIPAMKSDEVIKSSVENLVPIPKHSETIIDFNDDSTSSDDDSPYGEDIDYVDASPPDAEIVSLEVVESVIPEVGGVDTDILLTIKDDILHNPTPSFDIVTKSSSTSLNLFLEETNTFDNSLTESETLCFDLEENSSVSTTTRSDYSLLDYEAFYLNDDHIEEKSSGSTTTHADFSLPKYDSFIFDLSINPFPPADRSDFYHEEFADELTRIISPPGI
ncbi:hypothetical protein Tco_1165498 [Tanacetum coccineum]